MQAERGGTFGCCARCTWMKDVGSRVRNAARAGAGGLTAGLTFCASAPELPLELPPLVTELCPPLRPAAPCCVDAMCSADERRSLGIDTVRWCAQSQAQVMHGAWGPGLCAVPVLVCIHNAWTVPAKHQLLQILLQTTQGCYNSGCINALLH